MAVSSQILVKDNLILTDLGASKAVCNPNHPQPHTQTYTLLTSPPAQTQPLGLPCAENQRLRSLSVLCLQGHRARQDWPHHPFSCRVFPPTKVREALSTATRTPSSAPAPDGALHSAPPPCALLLQGPAQVPLLWELSTALPRLLPEDSAPGTSRHLWTEHAAGVGVLTVTSDPRADLGGLQSLFSCDINYLKF